MNKESLAILVQYIEIFNEDSDIYDVLEWLQDVL